jgi:ABC-type Na+ transport system ATPase subunit NatA
MTGLAEVATKRVAGFSLGTGQRLDIAAALLGDRRVLIRDTKDRRGSVLAFNPQSWRNFTTEIKAQRP